MFNNEFGDNLSKYADPREYDETYKSYAADLEFIKAHLVESHQTIIELACGTGRLAIPLAKQGHLVHGVDIDAGMLEYAQKKADAEGHNIHLSVQDCTQLNLPIKSNFIYMTGNSFQYFLTNESQDSLFISVKKSESFEKLRVLMSNRDVIVKRLVMSINQKKDGWMWSFQNSDKCLKMFRAKGSSQPFVYFLHRMKYLH